MKNIHIIPTDKPSRLYKDGEKLKLDIESYGVNNQNIYITNSEEIKEDNWGLSKLNEVILFGRSYNEKFYKKIILTTDQDLITDGVQAIDNKFLEWFVRNPSCEFVVVNFNYKKFRWNELNKSQCYKIIIPQEEPKQEFCDNCGNDICCCIIRKQETLEQAANRLFYTVGNEGISSIDSFMKGASYQSKRMYSEEEVIELIQTFNDVCNLTNKPHQIKNFFQQFKKK
jgi:hypothetical protein